MRRVSWVASIVAVLSMVRPAAGQSATFVVELSGSRAGDIVCVTSDIPQFIDRKQDERHRKLSARMLELLRADQLAFLQQIAIAPSPVGDGAGDPQAAFAEGFDWDWLKPVIEPGFHGRSYLTCTRHGRARHAWDVGLVMLDVSLDPELGAAPTKEKNFLQGPLSLSGNSLRFKLTPATGSFEPKGNRNELAVRLAGGSYQAVSAVTYDQRATLDLHPVRPDFGFRLPESEAVWRRAEVRCLTDNSVCLKPTQQARIKSGFLRGKAEDGAEFEITAGEGRRLIKARHRVGETSLITKIVHVTWNAPLFLDELGQSAVKCPSISLADYEDTRCNRFAFQDGQCEYTCTWRDGFALPARVRLRAGDLQWEDTISWGHRRLSSFISPAPALLRFPRVPKEESARYVVLGEADGRGAVFDPTCPQKEAVTEPCTQWTSRIPRSMPVDLRYRYYGGRRFEYQTVSEDKGAYTLEKPTARPFFVSAAAGGHTRFRLKDGFAPGASAALGLEVGVPWSKWLVVPAAGWRVASRRIRDGDLIETRATSGVAVSLAALHCAPCAGSTRYTAIGWFGGQVEGTAAHPFSADERESGTWVADGGVALMYRVQPTDDSWYGGTITLGAARVSEWKVDESGGHFVHSAALSGGLWAWAYIY